MPRVLINPYSARDVPERDHDVPQVTLGNTIEVHETYMPSGATAFCLVVHFVKIVITEIVQRILYFWYMSSMNPMIWNVTQMKSIFLPFFLTCTTS